MTKAELINNVRLKLDEIQSANEDIITSSSVDFVKPLTKMIDGLILPSVNKVLMEAPDIIVPKTQITATTATKYGVGDFGTAPLPADILRIIRVFLPKWQSIVYKSITPDHPKYKLQQNKFTRGGFTKPVVVVMPNGLFELYPIDITGDSVSGDYVKKITTINDTTLGALSNELMEALSWHIAGQVLQITEKPELAGLAQQRLADYYSKF